MTEIIVVAVVVGLASGGLCSTVAAAKGYETGTWFAAGFFFNVLALIAIAGMPLKEREEQEEDDPIKKLSQPENWPSSFIAPKEGGV